MSFTVASASQLRGSYGLKICKDEDIAFEQVEVTEPTKDAPKSSSDASSASTSNEDGDDDVLTPRISDFPTPPRSTGRTVTPDTKLDTSPETLERGNSIRQGRSNSVVTELYFSPVDVNRSRIELGSPLGSPMITPTQGSFDASFAGVRDEKLYLSIEEIDRAVRALVGSEIIQKQIYDRLGKMSVKQSKDALHEATSVSTDGTSIICMASQSGRMAMSEKFTPFIVDDAHCKQTQPAISDETLRRTYELTFEHQFNVKQAPQANFKGLVLAKSSVNGTHISMISKEHSTGADDQRMGQSTCISLPQEKSACASIKIVEGLQGQQSRIILQIIIQILSREEKDKKGHLLIAEVDVTEPFTKTALTEVLHTAAAQPSLSRDTILTSTLNAFSTLTPTNCTMQTLTLLSTLHRIVTQFLDLYIVIPTAKHPNGVPSRISVPFISQRLDHILGADDSRDAQDLRELVVGIIAKKSISGRAFTSRIEWDGEARRVCCVPLTSGVDSEAWACFARDGFAIGDW